jgi:hypothetical protein
MAKEGARCDEGRKDGEIWGRMLDHGRATRGVEAARSALTAAVRSMMSRNEGGSEASSKGCEVSIVEAP